MVLTAAMLTAAAATAPPVKPNILFVLVDDMGYNDVSWHNKGKGPGWTSSPNLDALSSRGVRLEEYITNPICSPSRATIMTGRYTIRTGIQHSCYNTGQGTGLPLSEVTVANKLSEAGYDTWMFGKWHLGFNHQGYIPTSRGFDYHYGHYQAAIEAYNHTDGAWPAAAAAAAAAATADPP